MYMRRYISFTAWNRSVVKRQRIVKRRSAVKRQRVTQELFTGKEEQTEVVSRKSFESKEMIGTC
jgi:hypothetical protein